MCPAHSDPEYQGETNSRSHHCCPLQVRTEDNTDYSDSQSPARSPELRDDVAFLTQENQVDSTVHVELQGDVEGERAHC